VTNASPAAAPTRRHSLERELLVNIALLAGAALSLAVLTALVAQLLQPSYAVAGLLLMIVADVAVLFLFARYLLKKLVIRPLQQLIAVADELADGDLEARASPATTVELTQLGERFNRMTDRLLAARTELIRTEKLASIGRLATGVAHEVGNPLSAIGTYVEVLRRRGADAEILASIERETDRIDRIVRSLMAYARPKGEEISAVDVASVVSTAVDLLTRQGVFEPPTLARAVHPGVPTVRGSAHGLEQVIVNLLLNAVDAAPLGTITVGAESMTYWSDGRGDLSRRRTDAASDPLPERHLLPRPKRPEIPDGTAGVLLWVSDSGPGVPKEDRERVFDPFYTTKEPGYGTGLGLAIVQSTIHEMGGLVWVDAAREGGAAFKVFLPT
jgi:signal transduction histidine kinase